MKDYSKTALESSRPRTPVIEALPFCLESLYQDRVHAVQDEVVQGCTYEELIGALLLAKDELAGISR
jgi:hypothetical protein